MSAQSLPPGPLLIDVAGTRLEAEDREVLLHPAVGGVILFTRNCPNAETVTALAAEIHELRDPPLLVSVDQEGGRVQRLREGVVRLPPAARWGALWEQDPRAARQGARETGWLMAAELRALGVDLSYAPVADLGGKKSRVIGDRAFHVDPDVVQSLALSWVHGMHEAGMCAVAKHFPGHGGVTGDTHTEQPVDERSFADLELADLAPFAWLAANDVDAMMMSHVRYPAVAPEPASVSPHWIRGILRENLHFEGAVIADDLSMRGAHAAGSAVDRVQVALDAGCDFALLCNDRAAVREVLAAARQLPDDPDSQLRRLLLAPRGPAMTTEALHADPRWQAARERIADFRLEGE